MQENQGFYKGDLNTQSRDDEDDEIIRQVTQRVRQRQEKRVESTDNRGLPYKIGDRVRYKLNNDVRSKKGGKLAPRYSDEYEVVEVLGDGYTYNLKAVNHNGRAKSRHFNLLKTISTVGENNNADISTTDESRETVHYQDRTDIPESVQLPGDESNDQRDVQSNSYRAGWVRRSKRERRNVEILQADGKKKSYSSKAVDFNDSE